MDRLTSLSKQRPWGEAMVQLKGEGSSWASLVTTHGGKACPLDTGPERARSQGVPQDVSSLLPQHSFQGSDLLGEQRLGTLHHRIFYHGVRPSASLDIPSPSVGVVSSCWAL